VILGIFIVILLINSIMPDEMIHRRSLRYFLAIPGMILAIHCLSKRVNLDSKRLLIYCGIAVSALLIQFIAYHTIESVEGSMGLYSNIHHFGSFASLILPVLVYFSIQIKGWPRLLGIAGVIVAFYLFWESSSRISWLSFFSSVFVATLVFLRKRKLWMGLAGIMTVSFLAAYISGLAAINSRITDILINWRTEERVINWMDTIKMLSDNSVKDWLLGHGIGSFRYYFADYSTFKVNGEAVVWSFPHNVFFQIIFENGIIGLLTILVGMALLMIGLWRGYHLLKDKNDRNFLVTIFILFWINFTHCALTLNFYHKYFVFPLSVICGFALILLEKTGQSKPLKSLSWFQGMISFLQDKMPVLNRWLPKQKMDV
jgi:O-antigen ligase